MIHKLQTMNFRKAKMAVSTICLVMDFTYDCITWVLLALVNSTEPARFDSQCVQPGYMAIYPQSAGNRVQTIPHCVAPDFHQI